GRLAVTAKAVKFVFDFVAKCQLKIVTVSLLLLIQPTVAAPRRRATLDCTERFATWKNAQELRILLCIKPWLARENRTHDRRWPFFWNERVFVSSRSRSKRCETERNHLLAVASFSRRGRSSGAGIGDPSSAMCTVSEAGINHACYPSANHLI